MTGDALRREADQHDRNASILLCDFRLMKIWSVRPAKWSRRGINGRLLTVSISPASEGRAILAYAKRQYDPTKGSQMVVSRIRIQIEYRYFFESSPLKWLSTPSRLNGSLASVNKTDFHSWIRL